MRIDPELAATVAAVVEEGTLDAAARRLHLTPSAVSQRLSTLEARVGHRLVVRTRPARATPAGAAVLRYARQVALAEHDLGSDLGAESEGGRPRLPVAVNADSLGTWFIEPLARFTGEHDVEIELHREDQDRTAELLEAGTVVAAVTSQGRPVPGCRSTSLGRLVYRAVAAPAWLARWAPDGVTDQVLATAPSVQYDLGDRLQSRWLQGRSTTGSSGSLAPDRPPRHLVPATHDYGRAVAHGMGWGMLPDEQAAPLLADGRVLPLEGPPVEVELHWQRWAGASALLEALTDHVVAVAAHRLAPA